MGMGQVFKNNAATTLNGAITNSATSITVTSGAVFPAISGSQWFYATITQAGAETSWEIVKVTAVSGNTLTVVRGQQGTSGAAWANLDKIELRLTASDTGLAQVVPEEFALTGDISPSQITATQNDYAPTGNATATIWRLSSDASRTITGIAGGSEGRLLKLLNVGSFDLVLGHQNTGSSAANRILMAQGQDLTIPANGAATLFYDGVTSRWRCITQAGAAPYDAQYLVLAASANLSNERVLTFGGQFTTTDGGAGSTFTVKFTAIDRVTKTASYTATSAEYGSVIEVNSASATTQTLPTAASITGKTISYKNVGAGLITMATTSSQTIDGATAGNTTIGQWDTRTFYSDGTNWLSQGSQAAALQGASPTVQAGERRYDTTLASPANGAGGGLPVYVGGGIFAGTQTTDPATGSSPYAISPSGVGTRTLPANSQKAGSVYEIEAFVYYGSSQAPQFVLKYGASDSTGVTMATGGYYFHIKLRYTVLTTGATGSARVIWNITAFDSGGAQTENRSGNETLTINTTSSLALGLGSTVSGTNFVDMLMRKVI